MDDPQAWGPEQPDAEAPPAVLSRPDRRMISLIVAGLVVVALVVAVVWISIATATTNRTEAVRATASGYLTAIANADADAALDRLETRPASTELLTDGVLAASRDAAPLTDIVVGAITVTDQTATARVTYRLGTLPVDTELRLTGDGRSTWKIADGTADVRLNTVQSLTVNGTAPTQTVQEVFPGTYTAAATNARVALTGETSVVVADPARPTASLNVTHGLTEQGKADVLAVVKARLDSCLAATESLPADCPFGVNTEGAEVTPGSVRFTLANDPWAGFAPTLDPATPSVSGSIHLVINASATVTFEGRTGEVSRVLESDRGYLVDLTRDPLAVAWR